MHATAEAAGTAIKSRRFDDMISYQNDGKCTTADSRKAEIVSEYSNPWIDMRHDNALNSATCVAVSPHSDVCAQVARHGHGIPRS